MSKGIIRSVGKGGANESRDVKLVQIYLNSFIALNPEGVELGIDGQVGSRTIAAINAFQRTSAGMAYSDGRVDPNGKTFRYLTLYFDKNEQNKIESTLKEPAKPSNALKSESVRSRAGLEKYLVSYKGVKESRQMVSSYSKDVIKLALKEAGMDKAVITSTLRTPDEQAVIMLRNAKINLAKQYRLYGARGDVVLKVYEKNKDKKDSEILDLIVEKIKEFAKEGKRVSKHCVQLEDYKSLNVIDIGFNSTKAACGNFNASKFTNALKSLHKEGYIEGFIDETKKSNSCWHIEIKLNKKNIQAYNKNSILFPIRYINNAYNLC